MVSWSKKLRKVTYSKKGLDWLHVLYDENFKMLIKYPGDEKYSSREKLLSKLEIKISTKLHFMSDDDIAIHREKVSSKDYLPEEL